MAWSPDDDRVALSDVLPPHLVLVVKGGPPDRHAAHENGLQDRERRDDPGSPGIHCDLSEQGGPLLGWELVRDGPSGGVAGRAELLLQGDLVDLHHDAVDLVVDGVPIALPPFTEREDVPERGDLPGGGVDGEAAFLQVFQRVPVPREAPAFRVEDPMAPHVQRPRPADAGIFLAERPGGRVSRVGEDTTAGPLELLVQALEGPHRQIDLPPDVQHGRMFISRQPPGDVPDRPDVRCHVLACEAVPSGGAPDQEAVLVGHDDRQPVDLQLADELSSLADDPLDPPAPRLELFPGERVVERQHRGPVADRREKFGGSSTHPLSWAVRRDELGKLRLQPLELPDEPVVLRVGDDRVVEGVVPVGVEIDLLAELFHPLARIRETPLLFLVALLLRPGEITVRHGSRGPGHQAASSSEPATPIRSPLITIAPWTPEIAFRWRSAEPSLPGLARMALAAAAAASARMHDVATTTRPSPDPLPRVL